MEANPPEEPVDVRARRRLRELRTEQGLTLEQVAERANIDISTLSRLEAGKRRLALDHLPALAAALGVSADQLLGSGPPQDPRIRERPQTHDGMTVWPLTRSGPAGGPRAYKVNISRERRTPPDVCLYTRVTTGSTSSPALCGCCSAMKSSRSTRATRSSSPAGRRTGFGAVDGPVELIMIVGPQGERLHLHR